MAAEPVDSLSPAKASEWAAAAKPTAALLRRRFKDRMARWVVMAGGMAIIAGVLGILLFIVAEVLPMAAPPAASSRPPLPAGRGETPLLIGAEENGEIAYALLPSGSLEFLRLKDGSVVDRSALPSLQGRRATSAWRALLGSHIVIGSDDGRMATVRLAFPIRFEDDPKAPGGLRRIVDIDVKEEAPAAIDPAGAALVAVVRQPVQDGFCAAAITAGGRLHFVHLAEKKLMSGEVRRKEFRHDLTPAIGGSPACIALDRMRESLYVGTREGAIVHVDVADPERPAVVDRVPLAGASPVTALGFTLGDQSVIVGGEDGRVSAWFQVEDAGAPLGRRLRLIREFERHGAAVTAISGSERDKGFATGDRAGGLRLHHATSGRTLATLKGAESTVTRLLITPKADALIAVHENGVVNRWRLDNPHPEVSLPALFGPVWYEGYPEPDHVWQSTGGTDDFEPKFGLWPLMVGTMKGTVYALIIAVPLAILGAIYTAHFMHPSVRNIVKPTIEVMAALPSVVLGFLAGLWLAPVLERLTPALLMMAVALPLSTLAALAAWRLIPVHIRHRWHDRAELLLILPAILGAGWLCVRLNGPLEALLFGGDFRTWWTSTTGLVFDQRNALVVGVAMGFAVIPVIFTISEDAIANVPRHLTSGSLALGATRWQTAIRVVLPTASPGIFSAVMIGFGRAVGETMIVLMATGNTPVRDWNIFNGFRTLAANIAVEIPEAPHGGTLYRVLFLSALLLFAATFLVNTAAEVVRMKMRKRFAHL